MICDTLIRHYHSDSFSGLVGSAVEVYARSSPLPGGSGGLPPIVTSGGVVGDKSGMPYTRPALFSVILPVIGENMVRASLENGSQWQTYLSSLLDLRDAERCDDAHVRVLPVLPTDRIDYSNAPLIVRLTDKQGVAEGHISFLREPRKAHAPAERGELMRDLGQAIIQDLLRKPGDDDRLTVFISHSRQDIADDRSDTTPKGPVAKVQALANKTKLATFVDVHDLQAGEDWDEKIRQRARKSALLMIRTDHYSSREWAQWEVLEAKKSGVPIVCLSALTRGEQRGSFLLDHVPTVVYPASSETTLDARKQIVERSPRRESPDRSQGKKRLAARREDEAIITALNRLVDESLKRALWRHQDIPRDVERRLASDTDVADADSPSSNDDGFDAAPVHAPEPLMLTRFLTEHKNRFPKDTHLWLMHPDPPLLPPEHEVMVELCELSGYEREHIHLLTPRTFFAAGGKYRGGEPTLSTPNLVLHRPLANQKLGISMALSENLKAVGLRADHLELAVAEVAQMMLLAGGGITYAGAVGTHAPDLTAAVVDTVERYIESAKLEQHRQHGILTKNQEKLHPGQMFELTVPCVSIPNQETIDRLKRTAREFASTGRVCVLDENGKLCEPDEISTWKDDPVKNAKALTNVRKALPSCCEARLVIGGKTAPISETAPKGYRGGYPGIVEEALYTVRADQALFIAGGFGGAAAVLAHALDLGVNLPIAREEIAAAHTQPAYCTAIEEIKERYDRRLTGLSNDDLVRLTTTQRASELAGLVVKGMVARPLHGAVPEGDAPSPEKERK